MSRFTFCMVWLIVPILPLISGAQNLLDGPDCAVYDAAKDRYLVLNWNNGSIVAIDNEGTQSYFATGLGNAKCGHIVGNVLYATNGNHYINAYDLTSDELLWHAYIPGSQYTDGLAADNSGYLYTTDYFSSGDGIIFRFRISDQTSEVFVNSGLPDFPQELIFDENNNRLLLVSYDNNAPILAIDPTDASVSTVVTTSYGYSDGIIMDNDGNWYVACATEDAIYRYDNAFADPPVVIIPAGYIDHPTAIGYNSIDNILAVPEFDVSRVTFISLDDTDDDDVLDFRDNCPDDPNPDQEDSDEDGDGNVCDGCPYDYNPEHEDTDEDGVEDACDNCPDHYNPGQEDSNDNEIGDVCDYICGDSDGDRIINILDIVHLINYLYKSGPAPDPLESADVNNDILVNILDIVYLINYIYKYGPDPQCP